MIDTVKFRQTIEGEYQMITLADWLKTNYPENFQHIINADGSNYYRCKINNMRISLSVEYLTVIGSINKLWLGDNINDLKMKDIPKAIDHLNSLLGNIIDIKKAKVRRLDFGLNITMGCKPKAYISKLYSSSLKSPAFFNGETIDIGNNSRGMIVYDKTTEVKKSLLFKIDRENVPDNMLRLEVKHTGRHVFEANFGNSLPTVDELLTQLYKLPDIWYEEYSRLDKEYSNTIDRIQNQKDLLRYAITKAGFEDCTYVVNYSYNLGLISKQSRSRHYNLIKSSFKVDKTLPSDDLMQELDNKVLNAYNNLKNSI